MALAKSLIGKTVLAAVTVMVVCLVSLVLVATNLIRNDSRQSFAASSMQMTQFIGNQVATGTRLKRGAMIAPQVDALFAADGLPIDGLRVMHVDGIEVLSRAATPELDARLAELGTPDFGQETRYAFDGSDLVVTAPIFLGAGDAKTHVGEITILWNGDAVRASAVAFQGTLLAAFAVTVFVVCLALVAVLRRFVAQPLATVIQTMKDLAADREVASMPTKSSLEISEMVAALEVFQTTAQDRKALRAAEEEARDQSAAAERAQKEEARRAAAQEAAAARKEREVAERRAQEAQVLLNDLSSVLTQAKSGDFRARLDTRPDLADQVQLREMVNGVLETVAVGVAATMEILAALADRNLAASMDGAFQGAFAQVQSDANNTVDILATAMGQISQGASGILHDSSEVSSAAHHLARRTEQTAASLQQTAAALEEISGSVKSTAQSAEQARARMDKAKQDAEHTRGVVTDAVEAMGQIRHYSEEMAKIIGLINDIAFQTNLLALNAGVEAARAGESGRGFAVVASEVRALAQRAADASSDIGRLISESSAQVEKGVDYVDKAGEALSRMGDAIAASHAAISDIATSVAEQAEGVSEVNRSVSDIDGATQQNAAMFEETTAASVSLKSASEQLTDLVRSFKLREPMTAAAPPQAA